MLRYLAQAQVEMGVAGDLLGVAGVNPYFNYIYYLTPYVG